MQRPDNNGNDPASNDGFLIEGSSVSGKPDDESVTVFAMPPR